mmetsp:Transcript_46119/g.96852  ORF Transcript_46119/g.96852 Transcript_46119/m.96852 type:complete len:95 (-) Transcript_46119:62-346(-)
MLRFQLHTSSKATKLANSVEQHLTFAALLDSHTSLVLPKISAQIQRSHPNLPLTTAFKIYSASLCHSASRMKFKPSLSALGMPTIQAHSFLSSS